MLSQKREKIEKIKEDYLEEALKEQNTHNTRNLPQIKSTHLVQPNSLNQ